MNDTMGRSLRQALDGMTSEFEPSQVIGRYRDLDDDAIRGEAAPRIPSRLPDASVMDAGAPLLAPRNSKHREKNESMIDDDSIRQAPGNAAGLGHGQQSPAVEDLDNADRFISQHGDDVRYCHAWSTWLVYDGKRWKIDGSGEVERRAHETVRSIYSEVAQAQTLQEEEALRKHAMRSRSAARINAMIRLARSYAEVTVSPDDLDTDPWFLNVENGTVDLRTGELREHRREDLITKLAPALYDPQEMPSVALQTFLDQVTDSDYDLIEYIYQVLGYTLTGLTSERKMFILYGPGANGKTTLFNLLEMVLGDYAVRTPSYTVMAKQISTNARHDLARLKGARFVYAAESEKRLQLGEAEIKEYTGGDKIVARFLYQELFEFYPTFKIWLATNHPPTISVGDEALWDRIHVIPFKVRIPEEERVPMEEMMEEFRSDQSAILGDLVSGCRRWHENKRLEMPDAVREATRGYREEMDSFPGFFDEMCLIDPNGKIRTSHLHGAYTEWCEERGVRALNAKEFKQRMRERGFRVKKTGGYDYWTEIALRDEVEMHDELDLAA